MWNIFKIELIYLPGTTKDAHKKYNFDTQFIKYSKTDNKWFTEKYFMSFIQK